MCGIAGFFSLSGKAVPPVLDAMNDALVHRGPDDAGSFVDGRAGLAMRRLSIIGLANGHQPIFSEDEAVVAVVNGEIYNYRALREDLTARGHAFSTQSDVECVVHLYEEHGEGFLEHLRGMFSVALYDRRLERLLLARDRLGKKPLYYAVADDVLFFGSEIKALHASGCVPKAVNDAGIESYLAYGYVIGSETLFRDVRAVPPATCLRVGSGGVSAARYWTFDVTERRDVDAENAAPCAALLDESVRIRMMSEVPLGVFLSGGLDSSIVAALTAMHAGQRIETFTVGFDDPSLDELSFAREVAGQLDARHHEILVRRCPPELLRDVNWHNDEPAGDPAMVPTYCLSKMTSRYVTVVLTGEGGDEIFGGYRHYDLCRRVGELEARIGVTRPLAAAASSGLEPLLRRVTPPRLWKALWILGLDVRDRTFAWWSAFTDRELARVLTAPHRSRLTRQAVPRGLEDSGQDAWDELRRLLYVDAQTELPDQLLMKVDKMTMAASLEARCPLLDQHLVEFANSVPLAGKHGPRDSKILLKQAARTLVPERIRRRAKKGFDVPLRRWLLEDLARVAESLLLARGAPIHRFLDAGELNALWARFESRGEQRIGLQLWRMLNLAIWHDMHWPHAGGERPCGVPRERSLSLEALAELGAVRHSYAQE